MLCLLGNLIDIYVLSHANDFTRFIKSERLGFALVTINKITKKKEGKLTSPKNV